jgi:YVTN family beta-propeller protein
VWRDGKFVFTANGLSNDIWVIDAAAPHVVATIPVGQRP